METTGFCNTSLQTDPPISPGVQLRCSCQRQSEPGCPCELETWKKRAEDTLCFLCKLQIQL